MVEVTKELLPCPFCGGEAWSREIYYRGPWKICCDTMGCPIYPSVTERTELEAITAWNTRHQPQPSPEQTTVDSIVAWLRSDQGKGSEEGADWADAFADAIQRGDWK